MSVEEKNEVVGPALVHDKGAQARVKFSDRCMIHRTFTHAEYDRKWGGYLDKSKASDFSTAATKDVQCADLGSVDVDLVQGAWSSVCGFEVSSLNHCPAGFSVAWNDPGGPVIATKTEDTNPTKSEGAMVPPPSLPSDIRHNNYYFSNSSFILLGSSNAW